MKTVSVSHNMDMYIRTHAIGTSKKLDSGDEINRVECLEDQTRETRTTDKPDRFAK